MEKMENEVPEKPVQKETTVRESSEINNLVTALSGFQSQQEVIKFDSNNPYYDSRYASLSALIEGSRKNLGKHDLCVLQRIWGNKLETRLYHKSGQFFSSLMEIITDDKAKNKAQALGKHITYARRYAYSAILGLVADEDTDGNEETPPAKQNEVAKKAAFIFEDADLVIKALDRVAKATGLRPLFETLSPELQENQEMIDAFNDKRAAFKIPENGQTV